MKHFQFYLLIIFTIFLSSCLNKKRKVPPSVDNLVNLSSYNEFWSYWNQNIHLSEDLKAFDKDGNLIETQKFLDDLRTGMYFPVPVNDKSELSAYQLSLLPPNTNKDVKQTIARMADLEKSNFEKIGKSIPNFMFKDLRGDKITSNQFEGSYTIIKLWFINCKPCQDELPKFNELMEIYGKKNVAFMSLADDDEESLRKYTDENGIYFIVVPNQANYIRNELGFNIYPTYIILDTKGKIVRVYNNIESVIKKLKILEPKMVNNQFAPPPPQ